MNVPKQLEICINEKRDRSAVHFFDLLNILIHARVRTSVVFTRAPCTRYRVVRIMGCGTPRENVPRRYLDAGNRRAAPRDPLGQYEKETHSCSPTTWLQASINTTIKT